MAALARLQPDRARLDRVRRMPFPCVVYGAAHLTIDSKAACTKKSAQLRDCAAYPDGVDNAAVSKTIAHEMRAKQPSHNPYQPGEFQPRTACIDARCCAVCVPERVR